MFGPTERDRQTDKCAMAALPHCTHSWEAARDFSTRDHWWSEDQTLLEGGGVARLRATYAIPLLAGMSIYTSSIPDDRRLFAPVRQTHIEWWKTDRD